MQMAFREKLGAKLPIAAVSSQALRPGSSTAPPEPRETAIELPVKEGSSLCSEKEKICRTLEWTLVTLQNFETAD